LDKNAGAADGHPHLNKSAEETRVELRADKLENMKNKAIE
jgi:hypothetical protein